MAEMKKNLPPRAAESDRAARHHARRVSSWVNGQKRKESRRKAQDARADENRLALADLRSEHGIVPAETREVIRNGRTVVRHVQPSKRLRKALRELARRQAA